MVSRLRLRWVSDFHNRTVLLRVGSWVITTYALFAGLAFAVGMAVTLWHNARTGLDPARMAGLYLVVLGPAVLVGLRAFSIMLEWRDLLRRPLQTLVKPGYMLHGGILGGTAALCAIAAITGAPLLRLLDAPALALPAGEAIARVGCLVYGCCWGRPTGHRWGIRYTSLEAKVVRCRPHLRGVAIHPAQLYASVASAGLFAALLAVSLALPFEGALTGLYLIAHSLIRFALERARADDRGRLFGPFSHTNMYSAIMIAGGATALVAGASAPAAVVLQPTELAAVWPWVAAFGLLFGCLYGVHYGRVGSWLEKGHAAQVGPTSAEVLVRDGPTDLRRGCDVVPIGARRTARARARDESAHPRVAA